MQEVEGFVSAVACASRAQEGRDEGFEEPEEFEGFERVENV